MPHLQWKDDASTQRITSQLQTQFAHIKIGLKHNQEVKASWTSAALNYSILASIWMANGNIRALDQGLRHPGVIHLPHGASIRLINCGTYTAMRAHTAAFFQLAGRESPYPPIGRPILPGQAAVDHLVRDVIGCDDFGMYAADILFYAAMFGFFGIEPMLALFGLIGGTLELVHKMECGG